MTKKAKSIYDSPVVETMKCRVEKGFGGSDGKGLGLFEGNGEKSLESRNNAGNWGGGEPKWN